jgi:DNA-binding NtrC family response regulator
MCGLRRKLVSQGVEVLDAASCQELRRALCAAHPPRVVLTGRKLPDGTWADILAVAAEAPRPTNVIVVTRLVDTRFYLDAIQAGAFDLIVPPFDQAGISHILRCAMDNVRTRGAASACAEGRREGGLFPPPLQIQTGSPVVLGR